ncbi:MAG TPA: hypothetical protein VGC41_16455 [Kofleriaceae bacterium]
MQHTTGTSSNQPNAVPPVEAGKEEDSGLHDIRSLAQSTKQRISSKKITQSLTPVPADDDPLASSSGSWKSIALPQPAAMVSLPAVEDLKPLQHKPSSTAPLAQVTGAMAVEFSPTPISTPTKKSSRNRIAIVGMGVAAAAAGITLYVVSQNKGAVVEQTAAQPTVAQSAPGAGPTGNVADTSAASRGLAEGKNANVKVEPITDQPAPAPAAAGDGAPATGAAPADQVIARAEAPVAQKAAKPAMTKSSSHNADKKQLVAKDDSAIGGGAAAAPTKTAPAAAPKGGKAGEEAGADPDFNALLKEAGVNEKKEAKPKLDKTELSPSDFKSGMQAIQQKAAACYKGTQGSANVKLTIAPSGKVSKVTVSGVFAGKPEADCVTSAVKTASFPAWDGTPQSFGYPILLSE